MGFLDEEIVYYLGWKIIYNGHKYRIPVDDKVVEFLTEEEARKYIETKMEKEV